MQFHRGLIFIYFIIFFQVLSCSSGEEKADLVVLNGKIITVDNDFSIAEALAVKGDRIIAVGTDRAVKKLITDRTKIIDAEGRTVIPGLIDAHLHPEQASVSELDSEIPVLYTLGELLEWIEKQTTERSKGEWIIIPKLFFTRLKELHPPSLEELDRAAPHHPVFLDGSYGGMINSAAMRQSGITKGTDHPGIMKDRQTGLPTGIIKGSAFRLLKISSHKTYSQEERVDALIQMFSNYNRYGITSICSGAGNIEMYEMYNDLKEQGKLTVRVFINIRLPRVSGLTTGEWSERLAGFKYKTGNGDEWVKIGALKIVSDGGILTGTAYLREPWGRRAADIFGIEDPSYRGVPKYTKEELIPVVKAASLNGWKFSSHCTGGGGVDLLLDVFEEVNKAVPVKGKRFSIIHGNFFTPEAIERMNELDIYADMQAAWFYKDADAMKEILGDQRIKTFLPYRSLLKAGVMVNGGSDHMVKTDADKSINPYNPFLGMYSMVTRTTERGTVIVPEESISREEALKIYTINNAYASFEESVKGSVEPGKLADIVILSDDLLTCPVDRIKDIKSVFTIVGGRIVYSSLPL